MKTVNYILISCLTLHLFSCSNSNKIVKNIDFFDIKDTLRGEVLPGYLDDIAMMFYSEFGLILKTKNKRNFIRVYDTSYVKCTKSYGMIGRGPKEYLNPTGRSYNPITKKFFVMDNYSHCAGVFQIDSSSIKEVQRIPIMDFVGSFQNLDDSTNVILTIFDGQFLKLVNNSGEILDSIEYRVFNDRNIDYFNHYNNSAIIKIPNKELFLIRTAEYPVLDMYSYSNNKIKHIWKKEAYKSVYKVENRWFKQDRDRHVESFFGYSVSDKHIYLTSHLLTLDKYISIKDFNYGETALFIFDFNGNLLKSVMFDKCIRSFTVKPDDSIIYAIVSDPDLSIIKYNLN